MTIHIPVFLSFALTKSSSEVSLPERFGRRQGYAFITFEDPSDVEKALAEVNGKELLGREMRVQKATSGGPYTSENGNGENASGESRKLRPRLRAKVLLHLLRRQGVDYDIWAIF